MIPKKAIKIAALTIAFSLMLTGCVKSNKEVTIPKKDVLVTLVLDKGGVNDGSFNESAWTGAEQAQKELGVDVRYLESNTDSDYTSNIETAIDMNSDLIIGVGFNLSESIEKAAKSYPEQKFAIIDGSFDTIPENVTSVCFDEKQAGYLAGLATAKTLSTSDKFGFVGGFEVPAVINYRDGFEQGLKEINPNAVLYTQYANSFTDASKGRVIAEQMINQGVVSIVGAAGGVNNGIYEVCKEKEKYAVAVDMAQNFMAPDTILTSAIKKVDVGVFDTIKNYVDNKLTGGISMVYNLLSNGVGYEKTDLLTDDAIEYIENLNVTK